MTRGAIQLLKLLRSYGARVFPAQATLAAKLGVGLRTVNRHIQELKIAGLVEVYQRGPSSSYYSLNYQQVPKQSGVASRTSPTCAKVRGKQVEKLWNPVDAGVAFGVALPPHLLLSVFELEVHEVVGQQAAAVFVPSRKIPRKPPDGEHGQAQAMGASP